jgi:hypothetical protein
VSARPDVADAIARLSADLRGAIGRISTLEVLVKGKQVWTTPTGGVAKPPPAPYAYTQSVPAASWPITHNMGLFPTVTIVDGTGEEVGADVEYLDANRVTINFAAPATGTAYLS